MLFAIKQANQDGSASATAGMAQEGDAGLKLVRRGRGGESAEDRLHSGCLVFLPAPVGLAPSYLRTFALVVLPAELYFPHLGLHAGCPPHLG